MEKRINIIAFDVPYPPDYGGVIDIYYSVKILHDIGWKVYLHCFSKGRNADLSSICEQYFIYPRSKKISVSLPYIVSSRQSKLLEERLRQNNYPILFHGLHTTSLLGKKGFRQRDYFIRMHNVESIYYAQLAVNEKNILKKIYYRAEEELLKSYESKILNESKVFPLSTTDGKWLVQHCKEAKFAWLPCFIPWQEVKAKQGRGEYLLYHGNLSVTENEAAAIWLLEQVVKKKFPFTIAGKNPSERLIQLCKKHDHVQLISNPTNFEMDELIQDAQINILPSFNKTGVKFKLLHALFFGRHVIVNNDGVSGSGTESLCHIHDSADAIIQSIDELWEKNFGESDLLQRKEILSILYDNNLNAKKLENKIFCLNDHQG